MTQRFGALLDEAVSGLEPRSSDPVGDVVARRRVARRRCLGAGILAVAVLIGGGVAVDRLGGNGDGVPVGGVVGEPPIPELVGDNVVAGNLILPVPQGWRVLPASVPADCAKGTVFDNTILIGGPGDGGCALAPIEVRSRPIEVYGRSGVSPGGRVVGPLSANGDPIITSPRTYTLRGGEPAWLMTAVDDPMNRPEKDRGLHYYGQYYNSLLVPWSRVSVELRVSGPEQQRIIDTMRTAPHPRSGRLALPATAAKATLTVPDATDQYSPAGHGVITDPTTVAAVLGLLREQTSVVDDAHACAGPGQRVARLSLDRTTVIISLGGGCQEAVSSDGGRVRLSNRAMSKLMRMFGVAG
jgi:hypothetical protein